MAVTSQRRKENGKTESYPHRSNLKLTSVDSSRSQLSDSCFSKVILTFLINLRAVKVKYQNGLILFSSSLEGLSPSDQIDIKSTLILEIWSFTGVEFFFVIE